MTKQETIDRLKGKHALSMKDLRKFVESNPQIEDSAPVLIERVEDMYFNGIELPNGDKSEGWSVYNHKGFNFRQALRFNHTIIEGKRILAEGDPVKIEELEYNPKFIEKGRIYTEETLDSMKEQFYSGHCIVDNDGLVLIYSHY